MLPTNSAPPTVPGNPAAAAQVRSLQQAMVEAASNLNSTHARTETRDHQLSTAEILQRKWQRETHSQQDNPKPRQSVERWLGTPPEPEIECAIQGFRFFLIFSSWKKILNKSQTPPAAAARKHRMARPG